MPLLRKNEEALNSDRLFRPAEQVPRSGIYELLHESGNAGMIVLVRDQQFPVCQDCGSSVRFRLLKAAPHISEDPDFQ
jgi:hypothetical protein